MRDQRHSRRRRLERRTHAVAPLLVALALVAGPGPASAFVPDADRIERATVSANKASERSQSLQLELSLRVGDREPIGTGRLITHPSGLARLELRDAAGRVEKHLRVVAEHSASRNGEELDRPRAFLPPLSFLQVDSPDTLRQALSDYGLDADAAALAPCGEKLCYVLGDRSRVPPGDGESEPSLASGPLRFETGPQALAGPREPGPALWVDSQTFEIVRLDAPDGVSVEFGPVVDYDGVRFPSSITIHEPEREIVRFEVRGVTAVNAPAAGFSRSWLLAPPEPGDADPMGAGPPPTSPAAQTRP